jgi:hypothetical protein
MDGAEKCDVGHMLGWAGASLGMLEAHPPSWKPTTTVTEKTQNNTQQLKQHTKRPKKKHKHNPNQR